MENSAIAGKPAAFLPSLSIAIPAGTTMRASTANPIDVPKPMASGLRDVMLPGKQKKERKKRARGGAEDEFDDDQTRPLSLHYYYYRHCLDFYQPGAGRHPVLCVAH